MSGSNDPVRLRCPPSGVAIRWAPNRARRPANDDWNPSDWHILIVSARDPSLLPYPVRVAVVRDCLAGLRRLQSRDRPPLVVLTRFRMPDRDAARGMLAGFRRCVSDEAIGGDWFAMSRTDAVEIMGFLLLEMARERLPWCTGTEREVLLDYCGLNDASRFLDAEKKALAAKRSAARSIAKAAKARRAKS